MFVAGWTLRLNWPVTWTVRSARALLALEQLGTPQALDILAGCASTGDVDAARALARCRDGRAMQPLIDQVGGPHHRSAVSGLRDLRHSSSEPLPMRVAAEDTDDDVAVIATHGLVMARSEHARTALTQDPVGPHYPGRKSC